MLLTNRSESSKAKHEEGVEFHCSQCQCNKPVQTSGGTGYASNDKGELICYQCCGENDKAEMIATGKIVLYLTCEPASKAFNKGKRFTSADINQGIGRKSAGTISNWPGTLKFQCHTTTGRHNIAGVRYDAYFIGPDGKNWHGVTYGDNSQICRCKRTKS